MVTVIKTFSRGKCVFSTFCLCGSFRNRPNLEHNQFFLIFTTFDVNSKTKIKRQFNGAHIKIKKRLKFLNLKYVLTAY